MSWTNLVKAARTGLANGKANMIAKLEDIIEGDDALQRATALEPAHKDCGLPGQDPTVAIWKGTTEDVDALKAALTESQRQVNTLVMELELLHMDQPSQKFDEAASLFDEAIGLE